MTKREIVLATLAVFLVAGILIAAIYFNLAPLQSQALASRSDGAIGTGPYASDGVRRKIGFT
jgi:Na+-transporting NADH:ubiquinone oxidoreductase subunit NqrC